MIEEWRPIEGYEGLYDVSSYGRVRSLDRYDNRNCFRKGHILKQSNDGRGYMSIVLCLNGIFKRYLIHRLVAQTFIPNPDNLPQVNHKDENKSNNRIENLEWCNQKYNNDYGSRKERIRITNLRNGHWTGLSKEEYIKEYNKKYNQENKNKAKEYNKRYYQENKDNIKDDVRRYYQENKEKILMQMKEYYQKNKEKILMQKKEYRRKKKEDTNKQLLDYD